jgi:hypothetical protein
VSKRKVATVADVGSVRTLGAGFRRTLLAENKSPSTIAVYTSAVARLADFLDDAGMPSGAHNLAREHVESFIAYLLERTSRRPRPTDTGR